jgi:hypothetical protein
MTTFHFHQANLDASDLLKRHCIGGEFKRRSKDLTHEEWQQISENSSVSNAFSLDILNFNARTPLSVSPAINQVTLNIKYRENSASIPTNNYTSKQARQVQEQ